MTKKIIFTISAIILFQVSGYGQQFKALLFTKTAGWHHESINEGVDAIRKLGIRHNFQVDWTENAGTFINDQNLVKYDVIIFLNTTADVFNDEQQAAMEKFIRSGKGYVGIHSASDTEYEWPWYRKMVGRMFKIHPAVQTARLKVTDHGFPGMELWPDTFWWTDEWYDFHEEEINDLKVVLEVEESTYDPKANWGGRGSSDGMGDKHPIAWYHNYDGGRAFYTALGHLPEVYSDPLFLYHLYGGIYWAATGNGVGK